MRYVSQLNVLQELLYCFQGVDGNILKIDKNTGYTVRNDACKQSHLIYQLLEIGFLFNCVKKLLEDQEKCKVSMGLATAIQAELNSYHMHIAKLATQESTNSGNDMVVLTQVLPWAREKMLLLQFMITILEEAKGLRGGAILNPILKHLPHGNLMLGATFKELLQNASVPLYKMIWYWIMMGTIKDPFNEFFIIENKEHVKNKAWQCQFSLRNDYVPYSFAEMSAKLILDVGKIAHFINKFIPEKSYHLTSAKKSVFDIEKCDLSSFITEDGEPVHNLKQIYVNSSEQVLTIMKSKYKLSEFFCHLHDYILLMHGHFALYFMELMYPHLSTPVSEMSPAFLKRLLNKAVIACSPSSEEYCYPENIEIDYNEHSEDDVLADVFTLCYVMEGPIKIMFQIFDTSYRQIFMFLWKKNQVQFTLNTTWKQLRSVFKTKNLSSDVYGELQKIFTMNFQLLRIMQHLDFYIMYDVITKSVSAFNEQFMAAEGIDSVVDAHETMINQILQGIFIKPEDTNLRAQLTNIFSLVREIEDLTMAFVEYLDDQDDGCADCTIITEIVSKGAILIANSEIAIRNLVYFIKSSICFGGLQTLREGINYNDFYGDQPHIEESLVETVV